MYPPSGLGKTPQGREPLARALALLAAVVLVTTALLIFVALAPGPAVYGPDPNPYGPGCVLRFGPGHYPCHVTIPDAHIPQRIVVGVGGVLLAIGLFVLASRASRAQPRRISDVTTAP